MKHILSLLTLLPLLAGCAHTAQTAADAPRLRGGAYAEGYTAGRSNGIKQIYRNLQDQQREAPERDGVRLYEVDIPEHSENGVLLKPAKRVIAIQE